MFRGIQKPLNCGEENKEPHSQHNTSKANNLTEESKKWNKDTLTPMNIS